MKRVEIQYLSYTSDVEVLKNAHIEIRPTCS